MTPGCPEQLEVDHILLAVDDLAAGAALLEERFGLASVEGGRHPGWGTANRIVPLGDTYLELIAVEDRDQADRTPFGQWIAGDGEGDRDPGPRFIGWAVRTPGIEEVARRLDRTVVDGARARPDGEVLTWRLAGIADAVAEPALPFFIEWGPGTPHPGQAPARHRSGPVALRRVQVSGDATRVAAWLGAAVLPVDVRDGPPAVTSVTLRDPAGDIVLDAETLRG